MRFDVATIAFVGTWAFNVHATPVYTPAAWNEHQPVDAAAVQPAADADDSIQFQRLTITEFVSTVTSNDIEELFATNDPTVYISHATNDVHLGSLDEDNGPANFVREAHLSPSYYNYYHFLALLPLGFVGFTIFKGWRAWQKDHTLELHASKRARTQRLPT